LHLRIAAQRFFNRVLFPVQILKLADGGSSWPSHCKLVANLRTSLSPPIDAVAVPTWYCASTGARSCTRCSSLFPPVSTSWTSSWMMGCSWPSTSHPSLGYGSIEDGLGCCWKRCSLSQPVPLYILVLVLVHPGGAPCATWCPVVHPGCGLFVRQSSVV
jgi:hypothetical protein